MRKHRLLVTTTLLSLTLGAVHAAPELDRYLITQNESNASGETAGDSARASQRSEKGENQDTIKQMKEAARLIKRMESEPELKSMMQQAKGILLVPDYARAGLGIGGSGGEGILMVNDQGKWMGPAFYNLGGISIGAQAGVEMGSVAMLLMSDKALKNFRQDNKFSLDADAGLTIANYTAEEGAGSGRGDVVVWTDTKGAFAGATVGASDITFDNEENAAFYKPGVKAGDILTGKVKSRQGDALVAAMPKGGGSSVGTSSGATEGSSDDSSIDEK